MKDVILAIDEGTTGVTSVLIDRNLNILAKINNEFLQHYPSPGWVEHKPEEIWDCTLKTIEVAIQQAGINPDRIAGIGITNLRETTVLWERASGRPVCNAIVWQDRRTAPTCEKLRIKGFLPKIRNKTGLVLDPYFSATKIQWILENQGDLKKRIPGICFGTIDSYLVFRLTGGKVHVTDVSNASRTLLMNLKSLQWDPELLKIFSVPAEILPTIVSSSEVYGQTSGLRVLPDGIPVCGMAGDQQAALFGQACFRPGEAKCTYGTGSFLMMNTGRKIVRSRSGMLTTVAWKLKEEVTYAIEGSAFIAGAAVQWLRDGLKIIQRSSEVETLAKQVSDSGGVTFVPAFVGLGAPYWNSEARGLIGGMTRGTTTAHIARALLEGIAFLQYDILQAMQKDLGKRLKVLKVDGGACLNDLLMQFQSDILGIELSRPEMIETTALGAAFLAGLAISFWKDTAEIAAQWKENHRFKPKMPKKEIIT
ncbi:MAG: glycerol kinase GlpK, partial [Deltaproteobacteria bacterium]|nr:glycerol kinase GlpK [Deltaproteobacteria bacterium]